MKKILYLSIVFAGLFFYSDSVTGQGVAINGSGTPPDSSAELDVSALNKGLLMPRISASQRDAISRPATGLFIYNTDCNVLNYNAGTPTAPNWVTVTTSNALIAGVSISANPVGAICANTSVTFTATPANGINAPSYQWRLNGSNVGSNSSTYTSSGLNNGDVINCILTSSEPCVTGSPATSNSITMTVNPPPSTPGSVTGTAAVCAGATGNIYSISPVSGATSYNWTVPSGASIASGSGSASITVSFGSDSGNISVVAVNSCGTSAQVNYPVAVNSTPSTPGTISGNAIGCSNSTGNVYSVVPVNGATTYTWTVPGDATVTAGANSNSITISFGSQFGDISVTAGNSCGTSSSNSLSVSMGGGHGSQTFTYSGSAQSFTVPACANQLHVKLWGAGGTSPQQLAGGSGAYVGGNLTVTPNSVLSIIVGGGGLSGGGSPGGFGGGGASGGGTACSGGGRSAIQIIPGTDAVTAGGGGGGGSYSPGQNYPYGGGGGATSGTNGSCCVGGAGGSCGGQGGTVTQGGAGSSGDFNSSPGSYQAGSAGAGGSYAGGGGGGGYYGGSGGSGSNSSNGNYGGGGGGSSYIANLSSPTNIGGPYGSSSGPNSAANTSDPDYSSGVGVGNAFGSNGGNGLVVISW